MMISRSVQSLKVSYSLKPVNDLVWTSLFS